MATPPRARHNSGNRGSKYLKMSRDMRSALSEAHDYLRASGEKDFRLEPLSQALDIGFTVIARAEEHMVVHDLRPRDLAEAVGIETGYKWSWFSTLKRRALDGRFNPTFIQIVRLAKALGADPQDLIRPLQ